MPYASSVDVSNRLGRELDDTEAQIVDIRLSDAELIIRSRIKDLDDKIDAGTISIDVVKMIEAEMVLRLVRNPDGYLQESDGNYSYLIDASVANGRLRILDEEWRLLGINSSISTIAMRVAPADGAWCRWGPEIDQWWFP